VTGRYGTGITWLVWHVFRERGIVLKNRILAAYDEVRHWVETS